MCVSDKLFFSYMKSSVKCLLRHGDLDKFFLINNKKYNIDRGNNVTSTYLHKHKKSIHTVYNRPSSA